MATLKNTLRRKGKKQLHTLPSKIIHGLSKMQTKSIKKIKKKSGGLPFVPKFLKPNKKIIKALKQVTSRNTVMNMASKYINSNVSKTQKKMKQKK